MEINGKKVVDATKKAKIHITQADTVKGANKDPGACVAALAAKREIANCLSARVHVGRVYVEHKDKWVCYFTPDRLRTEIIAFDRGGSFSPGEYELQPPTASESEEARRLSRSKAQREKDRAAIDPTRPNHVKRARKLR